MVKEGIPRMRGMRLRVVPGLKRVIPERELIQMVRRLYEIYGCVVASTQGYTHCKGVTKGTPDLYVQHTGAQKTWWHEVKREGSKLRPEQEQFLAREQSCDRPAYWGGIDAAELALLDAGIVERSRVNPKVLLRSVRDV